jgi:hypothetical protein
LVREKKAPVKLNKPVNLAFNGAAGQWMT